eukprot:1139250-Pelagomonas_calceolata.AAC.9
MQTDTHPCLHSLTGLLCLATCWLPWPFSNADLVVEATGLDLLKEEQRCIYISFQTPESLPVRAVWFGCCALGSGCSASPHATSCSASFFLFLTISPVLLLTRSLGCQLCWRTCRAHRFLFVCLLPPASESLQSSWICSSSRVAACCVGEPAELTGFAQIVLAQRRIESVRPCSKRARFAFRASSISI